MRRHTYFEDVTLKIKHKVNLKLTLVNNFPEVELLFTTEYKYLQAFNTALCQGKQSCKQCEAAFIPGTIGKHSKELTKIRWIIIDPSNFHKLSNI